MKRAAEKKRDQVLQFRRRSLLMVGTFCVLAVALVGRAGWLQVVKRDFLNREADALHLRTMAVTAHRGNITDRHGRPLAVSTPIDSIWANPKQLAPAIESFPSLGKALKVSEEQIVRRINRSMDKQFVYLSRHVLPQQVVAVSALALPGINVQREYKRYYPASEVVSHIVGFCNIDEDGQEGLELAYNHSLSGENGAKRVLRDRLGRVVEDVESIRPPRAGGDLVTSIDLRIQYFAYRELKRAMQVNGAQTGSMVILDVETGEVLAMVNQPSHNPNDRTESTGARIHNRAITHILEPGSSMKPLIMASALEAGTVKLDSIIDTSPGRIMVGAKPISDHHDLGAIDLTTILARSSNVGITKVAMQMEPERLWRSLTRFGFGSMTASGFPGETAGLLSHYSDWRDITQATISYGYGLSVSPLQLVRAYAALGNEGKLLPISLLKVDEAPTGGEQVVSPEVAAAVVEMMEHVVRPGGTGTKAGIAGYRVAGKTGTAWKFAAGGYSEDKYFSIFAGLAPAANPKLAAVVVIDEPTGADFYGGDVAAPVFSNVMSEALRLLALPPDAVSTLATPTLQAARP